MPSSHALLCEKLGTDRFVYVGITGTGEFDPTGQEGEMGMVVLDDGHVYAFEYGPDPQSGQWGIREMTYEGRVDLSRVVAGEAPSPSQQSFTITPQGGKQSFLAARYDLLPPRAIRRIAQVLWRGAMRYGTENWKRIASADHLNHLLAHLFAYQAGDRREDHLAHAACRLLFLLEEQLEEQNEA